MTDLPPLPECPGAIPQSLVPRLVARQLAHCLLLFPTIVQHGPNWQTTIPIDGVNLAIYMDSVWILKEADHMLDGVALALAGRCPKIDSTKLRPNAGLPWPIRGHQPIPWWLPRCGPSGQRCRATASTDPEWPPGPR